MSETANQLPALERVPSGIAGLDRILHGGFLKGRTYLLMGPPGAGKTVSSNQLCFHHVATGGRALYLTLLAETSSRMLADLQSFAFFTLAPIADTLSYVSGYSALRQDGLNGFISLLRAEVHRLRATLLVIDGAMIAEQMAPANLDWKQFLHGLQASTEILGCTTFLLAPLDETSTSHGEQTLVEGVIELTMRSVDVRSVRELQVRKFRGSAFLEGRHLYIINEAGFVVHPRMEAVLELSPTELPQTLATVAQPEHMSMGIAQLDEMLRGGLPSGSTTLLLEHRGQARRCWGATFCCRGQPRDKKGSTMAFMRPRHNWFAS